MTIIDNRHLVPGTFSMADQLGRPFPASSQAVAGPAGSEGHVYDPKTGHRYSVPSALVDRGVLIAGMDE